MVKTWTGELTRQVKSSSELTWLVSSPVQVLTLMFVKALACPHCGRKVTLSHFESVAEKCDCRRISPLSRRFRRQSHFFLRQCALDSALGDLTRRPMTVLWGCYKQKRLFLSQKYTAWRSDLLSCRFLQRVSIASYAKRCISYDRFCPTDRPTVRHSPVSCQNDSSYDHAVFTEG